MGDPVTAILSAFKAPIAVIWYEDLEARERLVAEVESLASEGSNPVRVLDPSVSFPENRLILLVPEGSNQECAAEFVLQLSRDSEFKRDHPLLLFLPRDNQWAAKALPRGVIHECDPDMVGQIDVPSERAKFKREHGITPEEWLGLWDLHQIPRSGHSYRTQFWAKMLT